MPYSFQYVWFVKIAASKHFSKAVSEKVGCILIVRKNAVFQSIMM